MTRRRFQRLLSLALLVAAMSACGDNIENDPVLRLSAEEALEAGLELMEQGKYYRAREHFDHAFAVAPNSAAGREALLHSADSLFGQGGVQNYVRAEAKYRDFQTRFPTSDQADYVQFRVAESLFARAEHPDRDQTTTKKAYEAFESMIRVYPTSENVPVAQQRILDLRTILAEHEFKVAFFYHRYGNSAGAVNRLDGLIEDFPDYGERDKAMYFLGRAHLKGGQPDLAEEAFGRLRVEYPGSKWINKIPR